MNDQRAKADAGKPDIRLLGGFLLPLLSAIARVREYGCKKYHDPDNWKNVEPKRYKSAMMRHIAAYIDDEDSVDDESGISHLYHAACNIAFLIYFHSRKNSKSNTKLYSEKQEVSDGQENKRV